MATIDSLKLSITELPRQEVYNLISTIRANRRTRPMKKSPPPAKVARATASRKAPKQSDIFKMVTGMTTAAKSKLAAELLKEML